MRLVIKCHISDGYTYSFTNTVPVIYESAEAFAVDFEKFCWDNIDYSILDQPKFAGVEWEPDRFFENNKYYAPEIMTVDEWFNDEEN
jgi:hypothetical protein